jgi:methylmalonyl-CoA mutase N-terminal domain/subunit
MLEGVQREKLVALRASRNSEAVQSALALIRAAADEPATNLMPTLVEAVKARVTLGEISDVLRSAWGTYRGVAAEIRKL